MEMIVSYLIVDDDYYTTLIVGRHGDGQEAGSPGMFMRHVSGYHSYICGVV